MLGKKNSAVSVPTLAEVSPAYAELLAKRDELSLSRAKLNAQHSELVELLRTAPRVKPAEREAARLLGDIVPPPPPDRAQLAEIQKQIAAIDHAVTILGQRIDDEAMKASGKICEDFSDDYRARVKKVCVALIEAHRANQGYQGLVDQFHSRGVQWARLMPMHALFLGGPRDNQGPLALFLRDAAQRGFIEPDEIPVELR